MFYLLIVTADWGKQPNIYRGITPTQTISNNVLFLGQIARSYHILASSLIPLQDGSHLMTHAWICLRGKNILSQMVISWSSKGTPPMPRLPPGNSRPY